MMLVLLRFGGDGKCYRGWKGLELVLVEVLILKMLKAGRGASWRIQTGRKSEHTGADFQTVPVARVSICQTVSLAF